MAKDANLNRMLSTYRSTLIIRWLTAEHDWKSKMAPPLLLRSVQRDRSEPARESYKTVVVFVTCASTFRKGRFDTRLTC